MKSSLGDSGRFGEFWTDSGGVRFTEEKNETLQQEKDVKAIILDSIESYLPIWF